MAVNQNLQTIGALPIENKEFYERALLKRLKETYRLYKYAKKSTLPKKSGDTISWRIFKNLSIPTAALTEGVTPDANKLEIVQFKAAIKQYGDYITISDLLDLEGIDPIITETSELFGEQIAEYFDTLIRDVLLTGSNVYFAKGSGTTQPTTTDEIGATNTISVDDINKVKAILTRYKAKPLENGKYIFMISPEVEYDLKSLTTENASWMDITKYTSGEKIMDGEIGTFLGFKFVVDNNIKIANNEATTPVAVHKCLVFGKDAFGVVELEGETGTPKIIVKPTDSGGADNPLNQRGSVGWKHNGFTTRILYEEALIRFECASGLTSPSDIVDSNRLGYDSANPVVEG